MPQFIAVKEGDVGRNGIPGQLYNLKEDPRESRNVYKQYPEIVARLTELLDRYKTSGRSAPLLEIQ